MDEALQTNILQEYSLTPGPIVFSVLLSMDYDVDICACSTVMFLFVFRPEEQRWSALCLPGLYPVTFHGRGELHPSPP